jgi:predicted alpha/beta-hydrolase family hydrolase
MDIETPHGPARALLQEAPDARALLVLGHGAGGSVSAPDLMTATRAALEAGVNVALVEQPYRVAGRKSQAPAAQLDAAWTAVVAALASDVPVIAGGRSAGARVACRTAEAVGAAGVLCLAFPVHPPGKPEKTRLPELDAVQVPVLVIQGESDPFGMPPPRTPNREVVRLPGDHSLKKDLPALGGALGSWLERLLAPSSRRDRK